MMQYQTEPLPLEETVRPTSTRVCVRCARPWSWLVVAGTATDKCDSCDELAP